MPGPVRKLTMPHRPVQVASFDLLGDLHPVQPEREHVIVASKKGSDIMLHPDYAAGFAA